MRWEDSERYSRSSTNAWLDSCCVMGVDRWGGTANNKTFTYSTNNIGDKGHPWRTPLVCRCDAPVWPLTTG